MARISLSNVSKTYSGNVPALKPTSLEIPHGGLLVLVGPSGCGKSTLLRLIAGLEAPSSGDILIDGASVVGVSPKDRDVAMVFQSYALYPHMTVAENIAFGLKLRKFAKSDVSRRVHQAAEMLGLDTLLERKPKELSGGQRQRVALGRALVREPKAFLLDEPLSNLDAALRVEMRSEIRELHRRLGATMVYVTHDQVEAMTLADTLVVMRDGVVLQVDTPQQVYAAPADHFVASFIGSPPMNCFAGRLAQGAFATSSFSLPAPDHLPSQLVLGVRPEHLEPAAEGPIPLTVGHVEPLGHATLVHGAVGEDSVVVRVSPSVQPQAGDTLRFQVRDEHMHWFHADTGKRCRHEGRS